MRPEHFFCCYCSCCYCCFLSVFTELWYKGKCVWIMTTDEIQMWYLFLWSTIVLWNEATFTLHFPVLRWIHIKDKWHNLAVRTCPASLLHYILYLLFFFSVMFEFLSFLFQRWDLTFLIHYLEPLIYSTVSSLIFIGSWLACGHKIMEQADDIIKFLGWNCKNLLVTL